MVKFLPQNLKFFIDETNQRLFDAQMHVLLSFDVQIPLLYLLYEIIYFLDLNCLLQLSYRIVNRLSKLKVYLASVFAYTLAAK
jgi:hypothetical protein